MWLSLIIGLRKRAQGTRESGGFLLTYPNSSVINEIAFYDQFDKKVSETGIIQFKGAVKLYKYLALNKKIIAMDIHTHPTKDTRQSISDKKHPMVRIPGHIAMIAPKFASDYTMMPKDCSIYEYCGGYEWKKFERNGLPLKLTLI